MAKEKMNKVIPETYDNKIATKKIKIYPTFRLGDDDLPDLKTMEVGKKYTLNIEVEITSKSQGNEWSQDNDKTIRATFKMLKVGCEKDKEKPMTAKDFEVEYAKKRGGGTGSRYDK